MNNSKRKIKNPKKVTTKKQIIDSKVWVVVTIILAVFLMGAILFDQLYKRELLTINGDKYDLQDLSYYFYGVESKYAYYDQVFGGSYWDMTYDETTGTTMRDAAKDEAMQTSFYTEVLYREAQANGYSLTDAEKETIATNVAAIQKDQLTPEIISKNKFTTKYLTNVISKATLVSRYRQDIVDSLTIDDESIKAGIAYDEYRQYDIEYLFISTETTDADNKQVAMSDADKTAAHDKIIALYDTALTTADWSTLIPEGETELTYKKDNFLESGTNFSDEFEKMMMAMDNNDISEVYDAGNGYYIVRMLNNNSSESYDAAVKQAIKDAEDEGFTKVYSDDILVKYKTTVNNKNLDKLIMGQVTMVN